MCSISRWFTTAVARLRKSNRSLTPLSPAQQIGARAETLALQYLKKQGLYLLFRNYRCRHGEIDLIMQQENELIFIEVRYRNSTNFLTPLESITFYKQQRIIQSATQFLNQFPLYSALNCRFDIVTLTQSQSFINYEWIKYAFDETG